MGDMGIFYNQAAALVRHVYDRRIVGPPILDAATYFPEVRRFAGAWHEIRAEADRLAARIDAVPRFHDIMKEQEDVSANDGRDWRLFILKAYGIESSAHMAACPRLAQIVSGTPGVLSSSISFMAPGKHIPAHRGPFRGVLRFYLGLSVPRRSDGSPAVVLKIDGQEHRVGDGEWLIWDDTYTHEVVNESDSWRSVLLLDLWRREMPCDMALLSRLLVGVAAASVWWRGVG
jgi:aspartate beta-hydroxylase